MPDYGWNLIAIKDELKGIREVLEAQRPEPVVKDAPSRLTDDELEMLKATLHLELGRAGVPIVWCDLAVEIVGDWAKR